MATPGRLHLVATLALVLTLAGFGLAQAGILDVPLGGWGIDRPAPQPAPEPAPVPAPRPIRG